MAKIVGKFLLVKKPFTVLPPLSIHSFFDFGQTMTTERKKTFSKEIIVNRQNSLISGEELLHKCGCDLNGHPVIKRATIPV